MEKDRNVDDDFEFNHREGDFTVGQSYEKVPAKTIICPTCGTDKFLVGEGEWFTAVKCVTCDYEKCIHNG